ncbi:unnamed protein product [Urochloa humidicola]
MPEKIQQNVESILHQQERKTPGFFLCKSILHVIPDA